MQRLHDKREQLESAQRAGVDIPRTVFVDGDDDLARGAEEIGFPAIFKPVESLAFKTRFRRHVLEIGSRDELLRVYDKVRDCGTLMLQDIVPGGDEELYTLGSYLDAQSRPLAQFTGHKLRQHPPQFGHVSMAVSLWVPELAEAGLRLLHELGYHGVSQVEFKRDPRDGALPAHGDQRAPLDVALARHRLRRQPLARRLPRRHRRALHGAAPDRRRQVGRLAHRRARRVRALAPRGREARPVAQVVPRRQGGRALLAQGPCPRARCSPGASSATSSRARASRRRETSREARALPRGGGRDAARRRLPGPATPAASTSSAGSRRTASPCWPSTPTPGPSA